MFYTNFLIANIYPFTFKFILCFVDASLTKYGYLKVKLLQDAFQFYYLSLGSCRPGDPQFLGELPHKYIWVECA